MKLLGTTSPASLTFELTLALVVATAADLCWSTFLGYSLRYDAVKLALLDAALLATAVVPAFAVLQIARRLSPTRRWLGRTPWFCWLAAAWAPVTVVRLKHDPSPSGLALQGTALAVLTGVWVLERRRDDPRMGLTAPLFVAGTALAITALVVAGSTPGAGKLAAGSAARGEQPASPERPNLLLVVLDTTRADHLGLYGYARPTSPRLDAFAEGATVFEHAVAASSYTLPSHATLFTGLYPSSHGATVAPGGISLKELGLQKDFAPVRPLSREATTLAELARDAGLATGAVCANSAYLSRAFGFDQGFDTYVDGHTVPGAARPAGLWIGSRYLLRRSWRFMRLLRGQERYYLLASEVNHLALDWLEPRRDRRFCLFLNYMDPHAPYLPVAPYDRLFPLASARQELDEEAIRSGPLVDAYDAEIRYLDDHLGMLFDRLEDWDLLDKTLVVITGDHGESFGEHGKLGHAVSVYEPELRIPLVVRRPGQDEGRRVEHVVHLVDVLPTVIEELVLRSSNALQGTSLFNADRPYPVVASLGEYERDYAEQALYREPWKLIRRSNGEVELYDLRQDPGEARELAAVEPEVVAEMTDALDRFERDVKLRFSAETMDVDEDVLERLRALGYIK